MINKGARLPEYGQLVEVSQQGEEVQRRQQEHEPELLRHARNVGAEILAQVNQVATAEP